MLRTYFAAGTTLAENAAWGRRRSKWLSTPAEMAVTVGLGGPVRPPGAWTKELVLQGAEWAMKVIGSRPPVETKMSMWTEPTDTKLPMQPLPAGALMREATTGLAEAPMQPVMSKPAPTTEGPPMRMLTTSLT